MRQLLYRDSKEARKRTVPTLDKKKGKETFPFFNSPSGSALVASLGFMTAMMGPPMDMQLFGSYKLLEDVR